MMDWHDVWCSVSSFFPWIHIFLLTSSLSLPAKSHKIPFLKDVSSTTIKSLLTMMSQYSDRKCIPFDLHFLLASQISLVVFAKKNGYRKPTISLFERNTMTILLTPVSQDKFCLNPQCNRKTRLKMLIIDQGPLLFNGVVFSCHDLWFWTSKTVCKWPAREIQYVAEEVVLPDFSVSKLLFS